MADLTAFAPCATCRCHELHRLTGPLKERMQISHDILRRIATTLPLGMYRVRGHKEATAGFSTLYLIQTGPHSLWWPDLPCLRSRSLIMRPWSCDDI